MTARPADEAREQAVRDAVAADNDADLSYAIARIAALADPFMDPQRGTAVARALRPVLAERERAAEQRGRHAAAKAIEADVCSGYGWNSHARRRAARLARGSEPTP